MGYIGAGISRFNTADSLTVTGDVTASGTVLPTGDTAAGDAAAVGFTSAEGLILTGQGSSSDLTIKNDADATVFSVPTGQQKILFPDNARALFGDGSDLQIYHDGSDSYINDTGTGNLRLAGSANVEIISSGGEFMAKFVADGASTLYHNNVAKIATTSTGVDVNGNAKFTGTGRIIKFDKNGSGEDNAIYYDNTTASNNLFVGRDSSNVAFRTDGSERMRLTSAGFLGLGTTAPAHNVEIVATNAGSVNDSLQIRNNATSSGTGSRIRFINSTDNTSDTNGASISSVRNGDDNDLVFETENATRMTIDHVGNVGISNTAPDFNLSVGNSSSVNPSIQIMSATNSNAQLLFDDGAGAAGYRGTVVYGNATDSMSFSTAGSERMRLDASGNLLVGKTADNVATVGIEARATGPLISTRDGSDALRLNRLNSDGEIIQLRKDGTVIGSIGTQNWGIGTSSPSFGTTSSAGLEISHATRGIIRLEGNSAAQALELYGDSTGGTIDARGSGAALQFDLGGSEKARFDSSGRLLISTTSLINNDGAYLQSNGGSNLAFGFNVNYDGTLGRFYRSSSIVGSISVTTSATTYNTSSDRRLKSNIENAASASDKIDAIQVRQFDWNIDNSHQDYGLIAQELQPIEPLAVTGDADSDEMMGVDYSKLVPMLLKEIQELRSRVAALEE